MNSLKKTFMSISVALVTMIIVMCLTVVINIGVVSATPANIVTEGSIALFTYLGPILA